MGLRVATSSPLRVSLMGGFYKRRRGINLLGPGGVPTHYAVGPTEHVRCLCKVDDKDRAYCHAD